MDNVFDPYFYWDRKTVSNGNLDSCCNPWPSKCGSSIRATFEGELLAGGVTAAKADCHWWVGTQKSPIKKS